jgi:Pentapeptide repeats (8 copies)
LRKWGPLGLPYDSEHGKLWQDIKADLDKTRARASKFAATVEWAFGKKTARVLGVLALFAVVVALLFLFLGLYVAPTKPGEKKDLVLAVAQILAGAALLSGLYFTWRTLQVNREGQITERFTRAIEQLGATHDDKSKNLELRLGGIYALERIARESEEDHWSIMEVLTAYVRQHAPWRSEPTEVPGLAADIQAIITVLRRRTRFFGYGEPERLDLHETNLRGADLSSANLRKANLNRANLEKAFLRGANLTNVNLSGAEHLTQEQLHGTTGDENTQLPPDLKPPYWNVKTDEQIEGP